MKYFTAVLVCILVSVGASAGDADTLTLDIEDAVRIALQNNLDLKSERIDQGIRERAKDTARNEYLPGVNINTASSYVSEAERITGLFPNTARWTISAGFSADLDLTGTKRQGIRNALLEYEAGRISLETVEGQLAREVKKSFYYLILIQERIRIIHETIDTAQKRYDQALINYENGLVSELTVLSTLVTLENIKPELESARVTYRTEALQFKQLLGLEDEIAFDLQGVIDFSAVDLDAVSLIDTYGAENLSVQSLEKSIQLLDNQKKLPGLKGSRLSCRCPVH
jgi:outer membrane protein TolC